MIKTPRHLAVIVLRDIYYHHAFADAALEKWLKKVQFSQVDRRLLTELVHGCVRRRRTLDAIVDHLGKKTARQQPPDLRIILHLGFYQLRYLTQVPAPAAVDTTVQLAKDYQFSGLAGVVNGMLRQYLRLTPDTDLQIFPHTDDPITKLGIRHSFPDWMIQVWLTELGLTETEQLCHWFNQSPSIDLRVNRLQTSVATVMEALQDQGITVSHLPHLPDTLRLTGSIGAIDALPGFTAGWWTVQDAGAQLVSYLLDPQPGEVIIDACAAPGGKTTHIAELMADQGQVIACDPTPSRLKKLKQNQERLQLNSIKIETVDSRQCPQFTGTADRVLLDAPCSGMGTLHRRADSRWRQTPENVLALVKLQQELLTATAQWVKPGGVLVYAVCSIHPQENEAVIESFLQTHPQWQIDHTPMLAGFDLSKNGYLKVWPHRDNMDGFFMVRLIRQLHYH